MENNLFIGNLPSNIRENEFYDHFKQYGDIAHFKVVGRKRFGFVEYKDAKDARYVLDKVNGTNFFGRAIRIEVSNSADKPRGGDRHDRRRNDGPRRREIPSSSERARRRMVVFGLHPSTRWQKLKDFFKRTAGHVDYADRKDDFAIVEFRRESDLNFALDRYHRTREIDGNELDLYADVNNEYDTRKTAPPPPLRRSDKERAAPRRRSPPTHHDDELEDTRPEKRMRTNDQQPEGLPEPEGEAEDEEPIEEDMEEAEVDEEEPVAEDEGPQEE
mmetsp:Transcript_10769/g.15765  ORF Transcript_10769/g.15765 Transcript_10769/m.15765 type:complete len:273 (-) Transcript_10769:43-861(-)